MKGASQPVLDDAGWPSAGGTAPTVMAVAAIAAASARTGGGRSMKQAEYRRTGRLQSRHGQGHSGAAPSSIHAFTASIAAGHSVWTGGIASP